MSVRDRLYEQKFESLMRVFSKYPRKRTAGWYPARKRLYAGTADMSKTPAARKMHCARMLKVNREFDREAVTAEMKRYA